MALSTSPDNQDGEDAPPSIKPVISQSPASPVSLGSSPEDGSESRRIRHSSIPMRPTVAGTQRLMSSHSGKPHPADLVSTSNPDPHQLRQHSYASGSSKRAKEYSLDSTTESTYTTSTANAVEGDGDSNYHSSDHGSARQLEARGEQVACSQSGPDHFAVPRPPMHGRIPSATRAWADSPVSTPASEEIKALSLTPNGIDRSEELASPSAAQIRDGTASYASSLRTAVAEGSRPSTAASRTQKDASVDPSHAGQVLAESSATQMQPLPIAEMATENAGVPRSPQTLAHIQPPQGLNMQRNGSLRRSPSVQTSGSGHTSYHAARTGESPQSSPRQLHRRPSTQGQLRAGQQPYPDDAFTETLAEESNYRAQNPQNEARPNGGSYSVESNGSRTHAGAPSSASGHRSHGHESSQDVQPSPSNSKHRPPNGSVDRPPGQSTSRSRIEAGQEDRRSADKDRPKKQLGEWTLGKTLGAGSMGKVKLGISTISGEKVSPA